MPENAPRPALPFALLPAAALGWGVWFLLYTFAHDETLIQWSCWGGECSTDDWQAVALPGGLVGAVLFGVASAFVVRWAMPGLVILLVAGSLAHGWYDSTIDLGVTGIDAWITVFVAAAGVGALMVLVAVVRMAHVSAIIPRTFGGNVTVEGRSHGWREDDTRVGHANVAFVDHNGRRRDVRVPLAKHFSDRRVLVVYDPRTPTSVNAPRIGIPPRSADERKKELSRLRQSLRVDGDPEPGAVDPDTEVEGTFGISVELERLARLRAQGALTQEEFTAAKRRLLDL